MYFYSFTFFFKLSSTNLLNAQSTKHGKSTLTISFLFYFFGALGSPHGFLFALLLCPTLVEVLDHNAHKHIQDKEANEQKEWDEVQKHPLVVVLLRLHIDADRVYSSVHYLHPAVLARENEKRHERLAEIVEIVLGVEPLVARLRQAVRFRFHLVDVNSNAVVEFAFEQL